MLHARPIGRNWHGPAPYSSTLHTSGNHRRAATGGSVDRPRGLVRNQPGDGKAPIFWDRADLPNWIVSVEAERSGDRARRIGFGKALRVISLPLHAIIEAQARR